MPQAAIKMRDIEAEQQDQQLAGFSAALTALSAEYGIGIAGKPVLFTMEREDYERVYHVNDESELFFE